MSSNRDFYEVLGVTRDSDADTIKKAYRKLAMQYHPDRNPGDKAAEEKFKEAATAYDILSNPEKKAQYDRFGHAAFANGGRGGFGGGFESAEDIFANFGDIFGDFFGGGRGQRRQRNGPRRGADLRYLTEITLKDVITGLEKEIEFDTEESCEGCGGTGAEKGSHPKACGTCHGQGQVFRSQGFFSVGQTCPTCHGQGQIIEKVCKSCRGRGRQKQHRKIRLNIPAGVDNGTRLRVSNEGEGGYQGGPPGDLYVELNVKEDPRFDRDGNDLLTEIDVDYLHLILGGELEIETLTGTEKVIIPHGAQVGDRVKVSGQGVPSLRGSRRGDLYCQIGIRIPEKLSKEEERLLRDLAKLRGLEVPESMGHGGLFGRKKK